MDSNTYSNQPSEPPECSDRLGSLPAAVAELEAEDLDRLSDTALAEDLLALRQLADRLGGQWLRRLAAVDARGADQRNADALTELARRSLEGGWLSKAGGVRPQLLVTVDLDSLLGRPGSLGGDTGWAGPLDPQACRGLACDSASMRAAGS